MGATTGIAWTEATFNPWWGCSRVSRACKRCYAERFAKRTGHDVWGKDGERRLFGDEHWAKPLQWNARAEAAGTPMRVFCASMADVFEAHPLLNEQRARLWDLVGRTPWLTWQLLTKRPENVMAMAPVAWSDGWPPNVWVGTTVEDQEWADERIPLLLQVPAAIRFVSFEPLVGPVELRPEWLLPRANLCQRGPASSSAESTAAIMAILKAVGRHLSWLGIDWAIVGGESGPGHESLDLVAAEALVEQLRAARVPVFVKQDSGPQPGKQGRLPDELWALKQFPTPAPVMA